MTSRWTGLLALFALIAAAPVAAFTVVVDPGHGGHDPGAEAEGLSEAPIVLEMAERVAALLEAPDVSVVLTRRADVFVALDDRLAMAREIEADLFLSIHADSLGDGRASGLSVYRFDSAKGPGADAWRRRAHPPGRWIAGVPLDAGSADLGPAMMEMARARSEARSTALSRALIEAFAEEGLKLAGRPARQGGFTVLTAAEFPAVLIELGFLTSRRDRDRLTSPEWRARTAGAIARAIERWRNDAEEGF